MSGLLHRLAARALGQAAFVRSDARLPFASIAARSDGAGYGAEPSRGADDDRRSVVIASIPSLQFEPPASAAYGSTPRRHASDEAVATRTSPPAAAPPFAAPPPVRHDPSPVPDTGSDARAPAAIHPGRVHSGTRAVPAHDVIAETPRTEPHRHADELRRDDVPPRGSTPMLREPSVLVPLEAPASTPSPRPRGAAAPAHSAGRAEPADVHVHIGRIEINAVHEPAPRRAAASSSVPPMTLDAYLARRNRS